MPAKYLAGANLKVYWEEWQLNTYQKYIAIYQNGHLKVVTPAFDRFKLIQSPKSQKITRYVVQIRSSSTKKTPLPSISTFYAPHPIHTRGTPPQCGSCPTSHCCPRSWRPRCWREFSMVPSGKHTKNYGKSPFLVGKLWNIRIFTGQINYFYGHVQ